MLKLYAALAAAVLALTLIPVAYSKEPTRTTFVAFLSAENEVPGCPQGVETGARGVAIVQIPSPAAGSSSSPRTRARSSTGWWR